MKEKVNVEIDRLVNEGIMTPITHSEWGSSIVTVHKQNGDIRLCGNYKPYVNTVLKPKAPPNINVDDNLPNFPLWI